MVKTRSEVKIKIGEWIEEQSEPFTTQEVKKEIAPIASNISLSRNRLAKYIQSTGKADYDKASRHWKVRIKPFARLNKD